MTSSQPSWQTSSPELYGALARHWDRRWVIEIYDLSTNQDSKLGQYQHSREVGPGDNIMIAGFILGGASVRIQSSCVGLDQRVDWPVDIFQNKVDCAR